MTDPNQFASVPNLSQTANVADVNTRQDQIDGAMRGTAAVVGYGALGINLLEMPGIAPKVAGAAFLMTGIREQYMGINGNEDSKLPIFINLRARVNSLGESLVSKSKGKSGAAASMNRSVGTEILDTKDKEYRTRFARVMGGTALLMSGVEFMTQPTTTEKIVGGVIAAAGYLEQSRNLLAGMDRAKELAEQRRNQEPPVEK